MQESDKRDIEDIAAAWVAREDRATLAADDVAERDAWLARDPRHFGAYARAHAVFERTRRARALAGGRRAGSAPVRRRRLAWGLGMAAALALAAFGLHALWSVDVYSTRRGEVLRVTLADGSAVTLDSDSQVRVRYSRHRRDIELVRGEALFDVAKNHARPFVVQAAGTTTTAVGTSFAVSLTPRSLAGVEVLVREGVVDVADLDGGIAPARLEANHKALSEKGRGIRIEPVPRQEVGQALAWREGMLSFSGDTLSVAAAQFLRYSDVRIVIDDPRVGGRRIVGLYAANDPVGFARSVALSLGLVVEQRGGVVRLRDPAQAPADRPLPARRTAAPDIRSMH
ncbi:FecR family protein [Xanthomonas massiliensis]|uniref:FecR family protein n=1 Tax=Xanthomonas massiliensis TaxID=1720302 RepID=UPI00098F7EA9|nr:FecR domain-containing protein [Xanthomonas massiliensis]